MHPWHRKPEGDFLLAQNQGEGGGRPALYRLEQVVEGERSSELQKTAHDVARWCARLFEEPGSLRLRDGLLGRDLAHVRNIVTKYSVEHRATDAVEQLHRATLSCLVAQKKEQMYGANTGAREGVVYSACMAVLQEHVFAEHVLAGTRSEVAYIKDRLHVRRSENGPERWLICANADLDASYAVDVVEVTYLPESDTTIPKEITVLQLVQIKTGVCAENSIVAIHEQHAELAQQLSEHPVDIDEGRAESPAQYNARAFAEDLNAILEVAECVESPDDRAVLLQAIAEHVPEGGGTAERCAYYSALITHIEQLSEQSADLAAVLEELRATYAELHAPAPAKKIKKKLKTREDVSVPVLRVVSVVVHGGVRTERVVYDAAADTRQCAMVYRIPKK
jgi:hypothetical protein